MEAFFMAMLFCQTLFNVDLISYADGITITSFFVFDLEQSWSSCSVFDVTYHISIVSFRLFFNWCNHV